MTEQQRENLEKMGGRVTDIGEFLGLSAAEVWLIDFKIDLGEAIFARRMELGMTREQFAEIMRSTPEKIVAMEEGGPDISLDEQMLALRALGTTKTALTELLAPQFEQEVATSDVAIA